MKSTPATQMKATPATNRTKMALKIFYAMIGAMTAMVLCTVVASATTPAAPASADATYKTVIDFFVTWIRRLGALLVLIGAIMFGLSIKNDDPDRKQQGITTMIAGFVVVAICLAVNMFDLFS